MIKSKPCKRPGCKKPACSHGYCWDDQYLRTDDKWLRKQEEKKSKPKKEYKIPRQSKKRASEHREYLKENKEFLDLPENHYCRVFPHLKATQVHHMWGRENKRLLDKKYWLPVSNDGHDFINNNPEKAYEMGFSLYRNQDPNVDQTKQKI